MKFNYQDAARSRAMRRRGIEENVILAFFKGKYQPRDIDWLVVTLREKNRAFQKDNSRIAYQRDIEASNRPSIPTDVLSSRDRRVMLRPKTITALICGDPLPGESALDRLCA